MAEERKRRKQAADDKQAKEVHRDVRHVCSSLYRLLSPVYLYVHAEMLHQLGPLPPPLPPACSHEPLPAPCMLSPCRE